MRSLLTFRLTVSSPLPAQWESAWETLKAYWRAYGGWRSQLTSPYLFLALLSTLLAMPYWEGKSDWVQNALDIVPGLLGFSIGAFAVLLVFSSDRFLVLISEKGRETSVFMTTSAMFVHFIILQVISIILAIGTKVYPSISGLGFFMLMYAVFTGAAAALALFNLAQVYNRAAHKLIEDRQRPPTTPPKP
jgi:hypothetical protein